MIEALGVILMCITPSADTCNIIRSPTVFSSYESCEEQTINYALLLNVTYKPAYITPMCLKLVPPGEPV